MVQLVFVLEIVEKYWRLNKNLDCSKIFASHQPSQAYWLWPNQTTNALWQNLRVKHTGQTFKRTLLRHLPTANRIEISVVKTSRKAKQVLNFTIGLTCVNYQPYLFLHLHQSCKYPYKIWFYFLFFLLRVSKFWHLLYAF